VPNVTVTRITDVATGAALYRASGLLRALQAAAASPAAGSQGVRVEFTVAVSDGTTAAVLQSSLSAGGGAAPANFATAVVVATQSLAQSSGSATLSSAFSTASALVVAPAQASPSPTAAAAAPFSNTTLWAVVGVLIAVTVAVIGGVIGYKFFKASRAPASTEKEAVVAAPRIFGAAAAPRVIGALRPGAAADASSFEMANPTAAKLELRLPGVAPEAAKSRFAVGAV